MELMHHKNRISNMCWLWTPIGYRPISSLMVGLACSARILICHLPKTICCALVDHLHVVYTYHWIFVALNSDFRESFTPDSIYIAVYQHPKNHNITERRSAWLNNRSRGRSLNEATTGNFLNNCTKKTSKTLALINIQVFFHTSSYYYKFRR